MDGNDAAQDDGNSARVTVWTRRQTETAAKEDAHGNGSVRRTLVERLSRYGMPALPLPNALVRRPRLLRQQEVCETTGSILRRGSPEAPERGSLTPTTRKKYLQELFLTNSSHSGLRSVLSSQSSGASSREEYEAQGTDWALYPMEHAWMLSAVDGTYTTILDFISEDPNLLNRRDFVTGFGVLHWLAKRGQDDTLITLLKHAEQIGIHVNVNLKGSGGLTPLHVAAMHSQYMVIKVLVGAYGANVDAMDYNGKRPWQYLKGDAPMEMRELLGTWDDEHWSSGGAHNTNNSASAVNPDPCAVNSDGDLDEVSTPAQITRSGIWRFGSFNKFLSIFGNKR